MNNAALLPLLLSIPLGGAVACALIGTKNTQEGGGGGGGGAKYIALLASLATLGVGGYAASLFNWSEPHKQQLMSLMGVFEPVNASITFGVNALSLLLALATALLTLTATLASFPYFKQSDGKAATSPATSDEPGPFYAWILVLQACLTGVWIARDLLVFYAFFELVLVPLFFLIGTYGGPDRRQAAVKLFVYTFTGSILALPAILYVGLRAGTFDLGGVIAFAQTSLTSTERFWVLMGLLASFCVKTPVFPLHTWQPSAMAESPGSGVVDCAGLVLKLGAYAILTVAIPIGMLNADGTPAFPAVLTALAVLAVIGILYGALCAWVQTDIKRVLAYSSLSHVGFIVLSIAALSSWGVQAAGLYLINTALITGALFLCVGFIHARYGTRDMAELSGLAKKMPLLAFFMGLFTMAAIGLPLLNGFVSEFLAIYAAFTSDYLHLSFGVLASLGVVLGAIYMLSMLARVLFGPVREPAPAARTGAVATGDLSGREVLTLAPLAVLVVLLGLFPNPVLQALKPLTVSTPAANAQAAPASATLTASSPVLR